MASLRVAGLAAPLLLPNQSAAFRQTAARSSSSRSLTAIRAEAEPPATEADAAPVKKKVIRRRVTRVNPPAESDVDVQPTRGVEDAGVTVEGVVRIDRGADTLTPAWALALLAGGDALVLVAFSYIGRATHVSSALDLELLKTAAPFLTGWFLSALLQGDYSTGRSTPSGFGATAGATAKIWALGIPVGIVIRSVLKGQAPQPPFVIVSLVVTIVLLTAWRTAYDSLVPSEKLQTGKELGDKSGSVFELFELLTSLVKRW